MKGVLDSLVKLSNDQIERIIETIIAKKTKVSFKLAGDEKIFVTSFLKVTDSKKIILSEKLPPKSDQIVTFKIVIDAEVYFFKTQMSLHSQKALIDKPTLIHRLRRRKDRRFKIPDGWNQMSFVLDVDKMKHKLKVKMIDFSKSGAQIHVAADIIPFQINQEIQIQFKIYKRGEITSTVIIRHIRKNGTGVFALGVEFVKKTSLMQAKIQNICEDLFFYYSQT